MAYDPYKSLLANASRDHLNRGADLNTHLVGNVFLPAIDSQHKKASVPTASLKHLKVIEQCIMAENKREERLANCATTKERRILTKKFQIQREHERELIQALMLGNYPDQNYDLKLVKTEVVATRTPRQQFNQDITGLSARVATPRRVFRKADVTGGMPKLKPHMRKQFKLPECNGSTGRKTSAKSQDAASTKLSSARTRTPPRSRETQIQKRNLSRSAKNEDGVRSPMVQAEISSDGTTTIATEAATSLHQTAQSPCISKQTRSAKAAPQLSALPNKPIENMSSMELENADVDIEGQNEESPALSFPEAQRLAEAMGSDAQVLKEKCEKILAEMYTQTTSRVLEDTIQGSDIQKVASRSELPLMNPAFVAALNQDVSATTPGRPHSERTKRVTRQVFLENLARENQIFQDRKKAMVQHEDTADEVNETTHDDQNLAKEDKSQVSEKEDKIFQDQKETTCTTRHEDTADKVDADSEIAHDVQKLAEEKPQASKENDPTIDVLNRADDDRPEPEYSDNDDYAADDEFTLDAEADEELETDVAETLFDIVDMVEAAITEEEKQKVVLPTPRTVSPRPRSSMDRSTKYALRIQSVFRGYHARIAFRLALYEDALSCGVLGAMPGTIQGRSGWYLDPKRLMAYYFVIPDPDSEWEQKYTLRCSRLVLTPYEMQQEVLSKVPALLDT